jgi:hypothetical protein
MIRREKAEYELPVEGVAWTRGAGHPAGIYLLDGRCHFVAIGSPAEALLSERGAVHVANVAFDQPSLERTHLYRRVRPIPSGELVRHLHPEASRDAPVRQDAKRAPVR